MAAKFDRNHRRVVVLKFECWNRISINFRGFRGWTRNFRNVSGRLQKDDPKRFYCQVTKSVVRQYDFNGFLSRFKIPDGVRVTRLGSLSLLVTRVREMFFDYSIILQYSFFIQKKTYIVQLKTSKYHRIMTLHNYFKRITFVEGEREIS